MKKERMKLLAFLPLFFFLQSQRVHAYIDPATTTYLLQIVSALVITLGVTAGVFFSRIRMFFLDARVRLTEVWIRIRNKEARGKIPGSPPKTGALPFGRRLLTASLTSLAFYFTFAVFGVYDLYMSNLTSFNFPPGALFPSLLLMASLAFVLTSLLVAAFRGGAFRALISLLTGLLLAGFLQGNFLNPALGLLTGDAIAWESMRGAMLGNLLIWAALLLFPFLLGRISRKAWSFAVRLIPLALIAAQLISMGVIAFSPKESPPPAGGHYLSTQGIYELGQEENLIVIVLDRLDNRFIGQVMRDEPGFFDQLEGFTRFTDNTSLYSQTFPSVTQMLTGEDYHFDRNASAYMTEAWQEGSFIPRLQEEDFDCRLYMQQGYAFSQARDLAGLAGNVVRGSIRLDALPAVKNFLGLSAFRYLPLTAKPFFWTSTDSFGKLSELGADPPPYTTDDAAFHQGLDREGLRIRDQRKNFLYIHLNGPHAPYTLDPWGYPAPEGKATLLSQTKGSFRMVFKYLDQLRSLGLYQSSTIVITGDHGARQNDTRPLEQAIVTGLFVKPAGRLKEPLDTSRAPVSSDNLRPFLLKEAGIPLKPGEAGYFDVPYDAEADRFLYHRIYAYEGRPARLLTYRIRGDANNFNNWTLLEETEIK